MKRVLVISNAQQPDASVIDFACRIADYHHARICGLLMESMLPQPKDLEPAALPGNRSSAPEAAAVTMDPEQALHFFREECTRKGLKSEVEIYEGAPLPHILRESYFADLIVLDPATSFGESGEKAPSSFTTALLREAHCPVLLAPRNFEGIDETVFCYDGTVASIHAAKLFTYLFPDLSRDHATILQVNKEAAPSFDEHHHNLLKWMRCHYRDVTFQTLEGTPDEELFRHLLMKRNKIIVMGAYGRGPISTLLRPSTADLLIHNLDLPFFICHL